MFIKTQFSTLFDYHWHTNKQIREYAAKLDQADYYLQPDDGTGSIHEKLVHLLRADNGWRVGLLTGSQQRPLSRKDYSDLAALESGFEHEYSAWLEYLDSLTEDEIKESVTLARADGVEFTFGLWQILQHIVIHGMQHHGEIAERLTSLGQSPGNIDFIFYAP